MTFLQTTLTSLPWVCRHACWKHCWAEPQRWWFYVAFSTFLGAGNFPSCTWNGSPHGQSHQEMPLSPIYWQLTETSRLRYKMVVSWSIFHLVGRRMCCMWAIFWKRSIFSHPDMSPQLTLFPRHPCGTLNNNNDGILLKHLGDMHGAVLAMAKVKKKSQARKVWGNR